MHQTVSEIVRDGALEHGFLSVLRDQSLDVCRIRFVKAARFDEDHSAAELAVLENDLRHPRSPRQHKAKGVVLLGEALPEVPVDVKPEF